MRPRHILSPILILPAVLVYAGCGGSLTENDIDGEIFDTISNSGYQGFAFQWTSTEIADLGLEDHNVVSFGREFDSIIEDFEFDGDYATIVRTMSGALIIDRDDGSQDRVPIRNFQTSTSVAVTEDGEGEGGGDRGWRVDAISAQHGQDGTPSTRIVRVSISWEDGEVVFEDGDEMHRTDLLTFFPGDEVTVRVVVNMDDVTGVLHLLDEAIELIDQKALFPGEKVLILENSFTAPTEPGLYYTYVDIFARDTFGDPEPEGEGGTMIDYANAAWSMPYHVNATDN